MSGNRRALATVFLVVFVGLLGFGIIIPILPFYVRAFGVSDVYIGLLAATYSLAQFAAAPYLGRLSDSRGRRPVILLSLAGSTVAWVLFGLGGAVGLGLLFVSRLLAGAMGGNIAAAQAYVADVTSEEDRAGALGLVGAAFGLGFVFGPALGGLLASDAAVAAVDALAPAVVPVDRFSLPSFAAAACNLLALGLGAAFLREPEREPGDRPERLSVRALLERTMTDRRLGPLVAAFFLVSVSFSGIQVMFIPLTADRFGLVETEVALLLAYIGVLGVLNQGVVVGRLSRWIGDRAVATVGTALLAVSLAALPFTPELGALFVPGGLGVLPPGVIALLAALTILAVGNGLCSVGLTTLVSRSAGADEQGGTLGITQGVGSLGRTVGPPVMGALYVAAFWSPFVAGALLLAPVLWALGSRRR